MTTITYIILKFESVIQKPIVTNYAFFAVVTFSKINSLYQFYRNTGLITSSLQKDFHQDNLSFVCLQFHKHNCLNILADNISSRIRVKKSREMAAKDSHSIACHLLAHLRYES